MSTIPSPEPLEIYTCTLLGSRRGELPPVEPVAREDPREVLDELLLRALRRPPCHVAFSGGRDSSAILAAATRVAREHGLPEPIPLTARYPDHPSAQESEWQTMVVDHLGLSRWNIFEVTDEIDLLGDVATAALRRYGPYLPAGAHNMMFMARQTGGGTMLTGIGGDEIFGVWEFRRRPFSALWRLRPRARALAWCAVNLLPARLRIAVTLSRARTPSLSWLQPHTQAELDRAWRRSLRPETRWRRGVEQVVNTRAIEMVRRVQDTFTAAEGVSLHEPFLHPDFLRAFVRSSPRDGYPDRDSAMRSLVGSLLPDRLLGRSTKATFNTVMLGSRSRGFAESWDGTGLDEELVDPERLRQAWLQEVPDARSFAALQYAWLSAQDKAERGGDRAPA